MVSITFAAATAAAATAAATTATAIAIRSTSCSGRSGWWRGDWWCGGWLAVVRHGGDRVACVDSAYDSAYDSAVEHRSVLHRIVPYCTVPHQPCAADGGRGMEDSVGCWMLGVGCWSWMRCWMLDVGVGGRKQNGGTLYSTALSQAARLSTGTP